MAERIVFVRWYRNGGASAIFTAAPDGTDRRQLTRPGDNFEPRWSPGGGRIAYTHDNALWLMRADGTNKHKVLARAFMPSWAPGGRRLLINRLGQSGVKFGILNLRTKAVRWYAGDFDSARASDWSPRNNRIVFAGASEDVDDFLDDVYTVAPDFTGRAQATNSPRRAEVIARWAPAGAERLAYSLDDWAKTNGSRCFDRVAIGDVNAGTRTRVSCSAYDPAWSPDASELLISHRNDHDDSALVSVDLSTGIRTVIVPPTKRFFAASEPDWRSCS